jgi:hypothetical protein
VAYFSYQWLLEARIRQGQVKKTILEEGIQALIG